MKYCRIVWACVALLIVCAFPAEAKGVSYDAPPEIQVGLWTKQSTIYLSADAPFVVSDARNHKKIARYKANEKVYVVVKDNRVFLGDKKIKPNELLVELEKADENRGVEVNKRKYRGFVKLVNRDKQGLTAINILPIEQYLYSVVAGEMPASWPMEAIKAQAVAARTFALNGIQKHVKEGYQVCATTDCQVYGGKSAEVERSAKAVDDTNGLVMLYGGAPISAMFHSSSGGYTENSENVWGSYLPYLRAVVDYDEGSPQYKWEKKFTPSEVQNQLALRGYAIGTLQAIELSKLVKGGKNGGDRTAEGRVKTIRFIGDKGNIQLTGAQARSALGLSSTWFDVGMIVPAEKKIDVPIGMYGKKEIEVKLPPYREKGLMTDKDTIRRVHGRSGETVVFSGFGWGHGLGLSQWGAKAMASKAPESATYFKEILKHYYKGIEIRKLY